MLSNRRVKIVATMGPSTSSEESVKKAIFAGMNVARLNFSHGTHDDHKKMIQDIRNASSDLKAPICILQDLQGPKVRVGRFEGGATTLNAGEVVQFSSDFEMGKGVQIPVDFKGLAESCEVGTKILLDDGLFELEVQEVKSNIVFAKVIEGGELKDRKGMNIPGVKLPIDCITEKDKADLEFGLSMQVDYVALSFVRSGDDIVQLREIISKKKSDAKIIAKIEMLEALEHLEDIIHQSDAVMVARGDLAVEVGHMMLPGHQKRIIRLCNQIGKPVITATQMLDSMVNNPRPTRAEVTDVANAVLDGSDALMLSAETASGKHPFRCISTMADIIGEAEKSYPSYYNFESRSWSEDVASSIAASACMTASKLDVAAIVCLTTTGKTASMISNYRPKAKIIAVTEKMPTLSRLQLVWGIQTFAVSSYRGADEAFGLIAKLLLRYAIAKPGDKIIITLGLPIEEQAKTNSLRVYEIHDLGIKPLEGKQLPLRLRGHREEP